MEPVPAELLRQADLHYRQGDLERARRLYEEVLAQAPGEVQAYSRLGAIYAQQGMLDLAEASLRQALALDPEFAPAMCNLGNVYFVREQYAEALRWYLKAVERDPHNPVYHQNLHAAYTKLGLVEQAVAALKRAERLQQAQAREQIRAELLTLKRRLGCGSTVALVLLAAVLYLTGR